MKQFLSIVAIILSSLPIITRAQTIELKVKDVGLGTPYQTVLRQLGKPLSNKTGGTNPCGGTKQVLRYSGLKIILDKVSGESNAVVLIEVFSSEWDISLGVKIGSSLKDVRDKLGQLGESSKESGFDVLTFLDGDGAVNFYFRNKKLVKVVRDENLC